MNNNIKTLIAFASGVVAGSLGAWLLLKKKYEKLAQEEIDSVKEVFGKRFEPKQFEPEKFNPSKEEKTEYKEVVDDLGYKNYSKEGGSSLEDRPYVITPDEFGENHDYETVSLTYYADEVLTTDYDVVIDDEEADDMVGLESLTHFGEHEDDSVFVRNDVLKTDYEILLDTRNFYPVDSDEE